MAGAPERRRVFFHGEFPFFYFPGETERGSDGARAT